MLLEVLNWKWVTMNLAHGTLGLFRHDNVFSQRQQQTTPARCQNFAHRKRTLSGMEV